LDACPICESIYPEGEVCPECESWEPAAPAAPAKVYPLSDEAALRIVETLRKSELELLGEEIGKIVAEKNKAYGDSASRSAVIMRVLYPDGIPPEKYEVALLTVRIIDKLSRIATDPNWGGEDPFLDIAGYGILGQHLVLSRSED
jgi:hypothetical protein